MSRTGGVRLAVSPVLTVGASPDFLDLGGMINLRFVGRRVRFLGRRGQREAAGRTMAEHRAALR